VYALPEDGNNQETRLSSNLSVKITADIADMQAKFAVAKAEVSGLSAEMNKLARASAAGMGPEVSQRLQQVSGDFIAAKTQAAALGSALGQASGGVAGINSSLGQAHGNISTATREFRALFDELSSGRTRMTPGTLAIIASRVFGLGPAALAATGGVLALVGGLAYLAYRAIEASKALDQMQLGSQFAGNLALTRDQLKGLADELGKTKGISAADAQEIVGAFAGMHDMSAAQIHALSAVVKDFATVTGEDATKAKDQIVKIFGENESAATFAKSVGGVAQAQINMAEAADLSGNSSQVFSAKLELLNSVLDRSRTTIDKNNAGMFASVGNYLAYDGMLKAHMSAQQAEAAMLQEQNTARAKQVQLLQQLSGAIAAQPPSRDQTLKTGVEAADKENPVQKQVTEANAEIGKMNAALAIAQQRGDQVSVDKLTAGLTKANEELSNLQFGPVLERMRADMEQVAATWDGTQSGMLSKQIQIGQATLAAVKGNAKEETQVRTEVARLEVQARQAAGSEAIATARETISQLGTVERQGAIERLSAERDVWQQVLTGARLTAAERVEVQRSMNQAIAGIVREGAQESQTIARQDAAADIAIARLKIDAAKSVIDLTAAADQAAVATKLNSLRQLTAEEFALNEQALENAMAAAAQEPAAYNEAYNQIRELKAKLVADLAALDRQAATASAKEAKVQASDWKGVVGEIEGAEEGMVSDLLNKRKSLSQSLLSIGAQLVTKEIANDLRAVTTQLLLKQEGLGAQKAMEQGGLLYHEGVQIAQTLATANSQAAQTGATATGNATRLASTQGAAIASKGAGAAAGGATVMADAAKAFSGTYASVAQIPYVGWILAPAAAGAAYAAVAAYEGLASLDVGTNYVAKGGLAQIHEGEAVVPKQYNPAAGGSGGGAGRDTHIHLGITALGGSVSDLVHSTEFRDEVAASFGKYLNRGGRG
jgi:hypothetical protein